MAEMKRSFVNILIVTNIVLNKGEVIRKEATLLKKTPSERKGIASVTGFGRQKAFWLEMYHLRMFFHLFKKVAEKLQCFAFLGQMHNLGLGKGLWKESMHFFPTCLNCSERWYHLSKMEDGQDFPRKGLNCKFQGNTSLDDAIRECNSSFSTKPPFSLKWITSLSQMDSAYTGLNYLSYWNEKTSF